MNEKISHEIRKILGKNVEKIIDHSTEFKRIFGVDMSKYFDKMYGFHITKFDLEYIKTIDGKSMKQTVLDRYGQEGVDLIRKLIA
jgi:hypothetical protein